MDIICTICWESLERGRILATTCGHIFHEKCIVNWMIRSHCCPDCRNVPTFPMRVIHFTWQEQIDSQEMQSPDTTEQEASSSECDRLRKTMPAKDKLSNWGYSSQTTAAIETVQTNPVNSRKTTEDVPDHRSEGGCRECKRFYYLLQKACQLRKDVQEYEKAHQKGSTSPTLSEKAKMAACSGPEAKRKRSL